MKLKKIGTGLIILIIFMMSIAYAVEFSPQGNINLKDRYNITNISAIIGAFSIYGNITFPSGYWIDADTESENVKSPPTAPALGYAISHFVDNFSTVIVDYFPFDGAKFLESIDVMGYSLTNGSWSNFTNAAFTNAYITNLYGLSDINLESNLVGAGFNITSDNVFVKSDVFAHTDDSSNVANAGTWYNVTFTHESDIKQGINHTYNDNTNDTVTIVNTGIYDVKFAANFNDTSANPDDYAYLRVINNGVEINGSGMFGYLNTKDVQLTVSGCVRADLTASDEIKLQFTSTSTNTNLEAQDGYLDHADSARLCLTRIR